MLLFCLGSMGLCIFMIYRDLKENPNKSFFKTFESFYQTLSKKNTHGSLPFLFQQLFMLKDLYG